MAFGGAVSQHPFWAAGKCSCPVGWIATPPATSGIRRRLAVGEAELRMVGVFVKRRDFGLKRDEFDQDGKIDSGGFTGQLRHSQQERLGIFAKRSGG